jgi:two-component system response regulator PilR (NtrC family)
LGTILIIDDEESLRQVLRIRLKRGQHTIEEAGSGEEGLIRLHQKEFDVVFTDLRMPGSVDGMGVLQAIREQYPNTQVVMMTAYASTETAIKALKMGAYDYITKPFKNIDEIEVIVNKCMEKRALLKENVQLRSELHDRYSFANLLGKSKPMRELFDLLRKVASANSYVLITGENGTGKELVARAIHYNSPRAKRPFVPVNCGAIPESLLENELFGHVRGAFTGAERDKNGLFRQADGGTLFLDEIGELPLHTQVKLLRVLEEQEIRPIGAEQSIPIDVRILSATNRDLEFEVEQGTFRQDLFYRLKVMQLKMPPLRKRREDIPLLASHFVNHFSELANREMEGISREAMDSLTTYRFPGNIRELKNIIERAVLLESSNTIQIESLPSEVRDFQKTPSYPAMQSVHLPSEGLEAFLEQSERALLQLALKQANGVRKDAAKLLHISFRSFRYRVAKLGIQDDESIADEPKK